MRVDAVARMYGVNAGQIYDWRKKYGQAMQEGNAAALLAVQVREAVEVAAPDMKPECSVVIEARGTRVTLSGGIEVAVIRTVLDGLAR